MPRKITPSNMQTQIYKPGGYLQANGNPSPYGNAAGIRKDNSPLASDGTAIKQGVDQNTHFKINNKLSFTIEKSGSFNVLNFKAAGLTENIVYLPYYQKNITSAIIPANDNTIEYFITDQMSGCNLFIDELPNNDLVIYHANALQHSPTAQQVLTDAGTFHPLAPVTMDNQHGQAKLAYHGAVNKAVLRVSDYYANAQAAIDRKIGQGRTNVKMNGGTTIVGFKVNGSWQFWFQTYAQLTYTRPFGAKIIKGSKKETTQSARQRILEARCFWQQ